MRNLVRVLLVLGGLLMFLLSAAYFTQNPSALSTMPWEKGRLSFVFMASMQAAIGAAMLWIGFSGELSTLATGALNLVVMMVGLTVALYQLPVRLGAATTTQLSLLFLLFAAFNLLLFFWGRRQPLRDQRPLPALLRYSYMLFVVALLAVGITLLRLQPVFPWELTPNSSLLFGWMFIGDAFYFLYALLFPRWHNARAQLWSFLAYDLVLLQPFIARFSYAKLTPDQRNSLIVYTSVLVYSGALAIYYLLINPRTRT